MTRRISTAFGASAAIAGVLWCASPAGAASATTGPVEIRSVASAAGQYETRFAEASAVSTCDDAGSGAWHIDWKVVSDHDNAAVVVSPVAPFAVDGIPALTRLSGPIGTRVTVSGRTSHTAPEGVVGQFAVHLVADAVGPSHQDIKLQLRVEPACPAVLSAQITPEAVNEMPFTGAPATPWWITTALAFLAIGVVLRIPRALSSRLR